MMKEEEGTMKVKIRPVCGVVYRQSAFSCNLHGKSIPLQEFEDEPTTASTEPIPPEIDAVTGLRKPTAGSIKQYEVKA
jgi:hypothetical protein